MILRHAQARLQQLARGFPVVVLTGPRQSGKTTLARTAFPGHQYVTLEDPDVRERVAADCRGFLAQTQDCIIDEVQRVPQLLSYLQTRADESRRMGQYVLTGSQNLLLSAAVGQSLAGRAGFLELLPLAYAEAAPAYGAFSLDELLVRGSYPALLDRPLAAADWHASYIASYVERDVRQISRIGDLLQFQRFMRLMAARCGQMLNLSSVANDLGIAQTTAHDWLAVLEASYIVFRLPPYHTNFGKRLVKTAKLYFHDTGLAAWLLGVTSADAMSIHPMRGAMFENLLIAEYWRYCKHHGLNNGLYFWRDNVGNEVDLLIERDGVLWPVEMKSGATFQADWLRGLRTWRDHASQASQGQPMLICGAPGNSVFADTQIAHWRDALLQLAPASTRRQ